ncbi:MAG: tetratricopeptide repeat protein [Pirellulaceae bacterium]
MTLYFQNRVMFISSATTGRFIVACVGLAWLLASLIGCGERSLSPAEMLQRGKYLSDANRASEAITLFDQVVQSEPNNAEAFYLRGLANERTDNVDAALKDYDTAIAKNPRYVEAFNNRAVLYAQQGEFAKAIDDFSKVLAASPKFALGYKNRGLAYHDVGNFASAMDDLTRAIELSPDAQGYFLRANLHLEQKHYADAIDDYDKALELDDTNSRAWLNRGMALARLGKTSEARKSLQEASLMDNEIVSKEIVLALRSLSLDPSVGLDIELEDVQQAVDASGWTASRSDDPHFPYTLRKQQAERKLFVALMDIDQESIMIAADSRMLLLDPKIPKSLLIATDSGLQGGSWRFVENWQPTREQMSLATVKVAIQREPLLPKTELQGEGDAEEPKKNAALPTNADSAAAPSS